MLVGMRKTATRAGPGAERKGMRKAGCRMKNCTVPRAAIRNPPSSWRKIRPAGAWWDGRAKPTAGAVGYSCALLRSFRGRADEPSALGKPAESDRIKPDQTSFICQPIARLRHRWVGRVTPCAPAAPFGDASFHPKFATPQPTPRRRAGGARPTQFLRNPTQSNRIKPLGLPHGASSAKEAVPPQPYSALRNPNSALIGPLPGGRPQGQNYQTNPIFSEEKLFG
jgi:hypothetical protein